MDFSDGPAGRLKMIVQLMVQVHGLELKLRDGAIEGADLIAVPRRGAAQHFQHGAHALAFAEAVAVAVAHVFQRANDAAACPRC